MTINFNNEEIENLVKNLGTELRKYGQFEIGAYRIDRPFANGVTVNYPLNPSYIPPRELSRKANKRSHNKVDSIYKLDNVELNEEMASTISSEPHYIRQQKKINSKWSNLIRKLVAEEQAIYNSMEKEFSMFGIPENWLSKPILHSTDVSIEHQCNTRSAVFLEARKLNLGARVKGAKKTTHIGSPSITPWTGQKRSLAI